MKARKIVDEMDSYVPGRSQDEIAQDFNLKKEDIMLVKYCLIIVFWSIVHLRCMNYLKTKTDG